MHNPAADGQRRIDRALHELRGNYPVLLGDQGPDAWLALSAEYYLVQEPEPLILFPPGEARLVLTGIRAVHLGLVKDETSDVSLPFLPVAQAGLLTRMVDPSVNPGSVLSGEIVSSLKPDIRPASEAEAAAVSLAKLAGLLPSVLVARLDASDITAWAQEHHVLHVPLREVEAYRRGLAVGLRQVSAATVPLEWAEDARVLAFRPRYGAVEHLAVLVGAPEKAEAPLVRVHSSCVTGDILGSLRCDCGEQLHAALHAMAEAGAGILLYMSQEGRGIGIANKLRAYRLQDAGVDTLDANREIGFAGDERQFAEAAEILRQLGVARIHLMSNNPAKMDALRALGIEVVARQSVAVPPNTHNEKYLETKRRRFGHLL